MKYLFEACFIDGTSINQNPEDTSTLDPQRSSYYDVVQKGLDNLEAFGLYSDDHTYVVDLTDGHFEINGIPFSAQPVGLPTMSEGGKFTLIYCRDHQHHLIAGADGSISEGSHDMQFRFGWTYTDPSGIEYVQTIVIV